MSVENKKDFPKVSAKVTTHNFYKSCNFVIAIKLVPITVFGAFTKSAGWARIVPIPPTLCLITAMGPNPAGLLISTQ